MIRLNYKAIPQSVNGITPYGILLVELPLVQYLYCISQSITIKCSTEKKVEQKRLPGAVSWYVTQLHPWDYFGATFKGGAVFA